MTTISSKSQTTQNHTIDTEQFAKVNSRQILPDTDTTKAESHSGVQPFVYIDRKSELFSNMSDDTVLGICARQGCVPALLEKITIPNENELNTFSGVIFPFAYVSRITPAGTTATSTGLVSVLSNFATA